MLKDSQSHKNHNIEAFACYVRSYNQETDMHLFNLELSRYA